MASASGIQERPGWSLAPGRTVKEKGEEDDSGVRPRSGPPVPDPSDTRTAGSPAVRRGRRRPATPLARSASGTPARPAAALPHPPVTSARAAILGSAATAAAAAAAASARDPGLCGATTAGGRHPCVPRRLPARRLRPAPAPHDRLRPRSPRTSPQRRGLTRKHLGPGK